MTATPTAMASFADAAVLLVKLAGVRVATNQVEPTAKPIGCETARGGPVPAGPHGLPRDRLNRGADASPCDGRAGKQPDGSA